jgi:hypothetical protein
MNLTGYALIKNGEKSLMQVQRNRVICIYINKCSRSKILVDCFRNVHSESGMLIPNPDCCLNIRNGNLNSSDAKSVILVSNPDCKISTFRGLRRDLREMRKGLALLPLPEILEGLSPDGGYLVVLKVEPAHEAHAAEAVPVQPADAVPAHLQHS